MAHRLSENQVKSGPNPHARYTVLFFPYDIPRKNVCGLSDIEAGPDLMWIFQDEVMSSSR